MTSKMGLSTHKLILILLGLGIVHSQCCHRLFADWYADPAMGRMAAEDNARREQMRLLQQNQGEYQQQESQNNENKNITPLDVIGGILVVFFMLAVISKVKRTISSVTSRQMWIASAIASAILVVAGPVLGCVWDIQAIRPTRWLLCVGALIISIWQVRSARNQAESRLSSSFAPPSQ